jgi:hypothetical protein
LTGPRWDHAITSDFIVLMVEEVSKLNIVRKLEEISTKCLQIHIELDDKM